MIITTVKNIAGKNLYIMNGIYCVPHDANNSDYKKIQEWINNGGVVEDVSFD